MPESEDPKKVSNNDLRNAQFGGGLIDAENVNAQRIGGDVWNFFFGQPTVAKIGKSARSHNQRFLEKLLLVLLVWLLPGFGLGITVHFILTQQSTAAIIALFGTVIWWSTGRLLLRLGYELATRWDARQELLAVRLADFIWSQLEFWAWEITSPFKHKYYKNLIDICSDYLTQGLKIKGPFTLNLEKVFVPLKVAPQSLERISAAMIQPNHKAGTLTSIWEWLVESQKYPTYRSIAIIGPPGSGKTTLLQHLALTYARNSQRQQHSQAPKLIPILIYLRDGNVQNAIASTQHQLSLSALIEQQKLIHHLQPPPKWFERNLCHKQCLVMLDGLDEVADFNQRQLISHWLSQQIQKYPNALFLVTSRPLGYHTAPVQEVRTILEIQQFNLKQIQTFIHNWYLQNEIMSRLGRHDSEVQLKTQIKSNALIERIKGNSPLVEMARNPLLLTMIATVHCYRGALPERRVQLYTEICDVLLGRRQDAKGLSDLLTAEQKKAVLQVLALGLMKRETREFTLEFGYSLIEDELTKVAGNNLTPNKFIENIEHISGLLVEKEKDCYEFAHKSFQEYLAAIQIKETNQEDILTTKISNDWWHETILLYAAQSNATNIIRKALATPTITSLKLALDCQEEGLMVEQEVRQLLAERLTAGLESNEPEIFQTAAEVKLKRRLSNLLYLNENLKIDNNYISCAEYQLFINDKLREEKYRQPDHWTSNRFPPGDANEPIVGIKASYAKEFCVWLTQQYSVMGCKYRIPHLTEIEEYLTEIEKGSVPEEQIGYWIINGKREIIRGIKSSYYHSWKERLYCCCQLDFDTIRDLIEAFLFDKNYFFNLAKNILDNAEALNFNYRPILDESLFKGDSESLLKQFNNIVKNLSFMDALKLNCHLDFLKLSKVVKPALADVLRRIEENVCNKLREIVHEEQKLQEIEHTYLKAQQQVRDAERNCKEAEQLVRDAERWEAYNSNVTIDLIDLDIDLDTKQSENKSFNSFKSFTEVNYFYGGDLQQSQQQLQKAKKDLQECQSNCNKISENLTSKVNQINQERNRYKKISETIERTRILLETRHYYLLLITILFDWVLDTEALTAHNKVKLTKFPSQQGNNLRDKYATKNEEILNLYTFLVILEERRAGLIPAWEGIRIVKEGIE